MDFELDNNPALSFINFALAIFAYHGLTQRPYLSRIIPQRNEGAQKNSGMSWDLALATLHLLISNAQLRNNSKSKEPKPSAVAPTPPPPPPDKSKPLPQPGSSSVANLANNNNSNHSLGSGASSGRASSPAGSPGTPDRRYSGDNNPSPTPPIVVVSPDTQNDRGGHLGSPERNTLSMDHAGLGGGGATPPRVGTFNRLRSGPKDTIPMVGKPPRKQRSSRFVVTEKVEIERLPPFLGISIKPKPSYYTKLTSGS